MNSIWYSSKFYPNVWVLQHSLKVYEYKRLVSLTQFTGQELVLDLGCGKGHQTCCLAARSRKAVGIDICDLDAANRNAYRVGSKIDVEFIQGELQHLEANAGSFDKIFSFCVIEHLSDHEVVLRKCHELLRTGGELLISVDALTDIPDDLKSIHREKHHVFKYFERDELEALLMKCGFSEVHTEPLFRSAFAKREFCSMIAEKHRPLSPLRTLAGYLRLAVHERLTQNDTGVFNMAWCRK